MRDLDHIESDNEIDNESISNNASQQSIEQSVVDGYSLSPEVNSTIPSDYSQVYATVQEQLRNTPYFKETGGFNNNNTIVNNRKPTI